MTSNSRDLMRSLDNLAEQLEGRDFVRARVQCADGRVVEGVVVDVGDDDLIVLDDRSGAETLVRVDDLSALEVSAPRRVREWVIAIAAIPVVTAILVAFSRLPGV